jgi:hypothetical protein
LALFGTYSDGSVFSGSVNLGVGYYTCLNPSSGDREFDCSGDFRGNDIGVTVACDEGTPCPIVASAGNMGPFRLDISDFVSPPKVYILNQGGTVSDITDDSSMGQVSFTIPAGTSSGPHLLVITDGVNFVDLPAVVS